MKNANAGTIESNDCYVTITKSDTLDINIDSIVYKQFGRHMNELVTKWAKDNKVVARISIDDKGALDKTIIARLNTALERSKG